MSRPSFPGSWARIAIHPSNLTLANTLPVGQSFLWHRRALPDVGPSQPREEFSRVVGDRVVLLRQSPREIFYAAVHREAAVDLEGTRRWLEDYFHLERYPDLEVMYKDWRERDPGLFGRTELDARAVGVRVLRQDPWECLIAFITSTNNHIARISSLMHKLSTRFSPEVLTLDGITYHGFPPPHLLPVELEAVLRELGFGYRAGFVEASLATLRAEFGHGPGDIERGLADWRRAPLDHVRDKLLQLKGVGRKVADCVMLMCLDQPSLIPIDTHVAAIAARHPAFPSRLRGKPMSKQIYEEVQTFLAERWGPMGGWTQAVMFAADLPGKGVKVKAPKQVGAVIKEEPDNPSKREDLAEERDLNSPQKREAAFTAAAHGFKRTRSTTRVELLRTSSTSGVAEGLGGLAMK